MGDVQAFDLSKIRLRPTALAMALWLSLLAPVAAQPALNAQTTSAASASPVRGIAPAMGATTSPAMVAPQVPTTATPTLPPITPTVESNAQPLAGGEIVARIDGQIVLASDVLWQVNQIIAANQDRIPPDQVEAAKRVFMRQQVMGLIDTKILYANFRRKVPAENVPQVEANLKKPFEDNEIPRLLEMLELNDRTELDALLRASGTSMADLRRQFNERTIAGEWLRQMVPQPKEATHEEMLAYYNEHKSEFEFPAQAKWEELMISFTRTDDRTDAWQQIASLGNEVWQRVSKQPGLRGPVFNEFAKEKSHGFTAAEGGQHDWTTKGALRSSDIDRALFTLKVGQLSNPIESDFGFHIIRVLERKDAGCTPFTEAQADIRVALSKDQSKGLAQAEIAKLRQKSRVWTIFDGDLSGPQLSQLLNPTARR